MDNWFPEPSEDIKQVIYEINHPRDDVWDIIKGHQEGDDYIDFLNRQFTEWIEEILKLADADHQYWQYLADFFRDLISMLKNFNLEQLGMFLQLYFPEKKEIDFQTLKDLDFAFAAIADGYRKMFNQVIEAVRPYEVSEYGFSEAYEIIENYANWAEPRYYYIGKFMPGYINYEGNQLEAIAEKEAEEYYEAIDKLDTEEDPEKAEELKKQIFMHFYYYKIFLFYSQLLKKVYTRLKTEFNFAKNLVAYRNFDKTNYEIYKLTATLQGEILNIHSQIYISQKYQDLSDQRKIHDLFGHGLTQKIIESYFPEESMQIKKIRDIIHSLEEKKMTENEIGQLESKYNVFLGSISYEEQVRYFVWKWMDYFNQRQGAPIEALGQHNSEILNTIQLLPSKSVDDLLELAKEYGIPIPTNT